MKHLIKALLTILCLVVMSGSAFAGPMDDLLANGVRNNNINMINTALNNGADINYAQYGFETPILVAIQKENTALVEYLLKRGADPNKFTKLSTSLVVPIIEASRQGGGLPSVVQVLTKYGADMNAVDNDGESALTYALRGYPNLDIIQFLIEKGANVNLKTKYGATPLTVVARYENGYGNGKYVQTKLLAAKMLLKAGADTSMKDEKGRTALHVAIDSNFVEMIDLLLPISPK